MLLARAQDEKTLSHQRLDVAAKLLRPYTHITVSLAFLALCAGRLFPFLRFCSRCVLTRAAATTKTTSRRGVLERHSSANDNDELYERVERGGGGERERRSVRSFPQCHRPSPTIQPFTRRLLGGPPVATEPNRERSSYAYLPSDLFLTKSTGVRRHPALRSTFSNLR